MAVDRKTPTLASDGPTMGGEDYTNAVNEEVEALWDRVAVWLDSVSGTNTITASADPTVLAISRNQQYNFIPANNNTGPVTISIDGLAAQSIRDIDGVDLVADALVAGRLVRLQYDGTNFRYLNKPPDTGVDAVSEVATQSFTSTGTYTPNARMIFCKVQMQAPGGGGGGGDASGVTAAGGGGGGGEYAEGYFDAATIGASQAVTIGARGAQGSNTGGDGGTGGTTSLGALLTAIGGAGGTGTGSNTTNVTTRDGGAGGTGGTGGSLRIPGGRGLNALRQPNAGFTASLMVPGAGGAGMMSTQNNIVSASDAAGGAGTNYGAGGAGGSSSDSAGDVGGLGGQSIVYITEYLRAA